jgi:hypothetical protein
MHYLTDIEEQIQEYRRITSAVTLEGADLHVLEQIQRERDEANISLKQRLATVLVDLGIKVDADAAVLRATSHEAA